MALVKAARAAGRPLSRRRSRSGCGASRSGSVPVPPTRRPARRRRQAPSRRHRGAAHGRKPSARPRRPRRSVRRRDPAAEAPLRRRAVPTRPQTADRGAAADAASARSAGARRRPPPGRRRPAPESSAPRHARRAWHLVLAAARGTERRALRGPQGRPRAHRRRQAAHVAAALDVRPRQGERARQPARCSTDIIAARSAASARPRVRGRPRSGRGAPNREPGPPTTPMPA